MSCLAHDKRFQSSFHMVINELRNEKRTPVIVLRTMPRKCCTCNDEVNEIIEPVLMKEEDQLIKVKYLIERVNREKANNPKLILSLNRFENIIRENRGPAPEIPEPSLIKSKRVSSSSSSSSSESEYHAENKSKRMVSSSSSDDSNTSSDSEDIVPMEISQPTIIKEKSSKSINNGTFIFLPYHCKSKTLGKTNDYLLGIAQNLQRKEFLGRKGHFTQLEKQYGIRINMITSKTSTQVTDALENAKKGLENLTIRNQEDSMVMSEKQDGEWILVRSKKPQNQTNTTDIDQVLDDLINRWESCLQTVTNTGKMTMGRGRGMPAFNIEPFVSRVGQLPPPPPPFIHNSMKLEKRKFGEAENSDDSASKKK